MSTTTLQRSRIFKAESSVRLNRDTPCFSAPTSLSEWVIDRAKKVGCTTGAIYRASVINFANWIDPDGGRKMLDEQIARGKFEEVLLLASLRRKASRTLKSLFTGTNPDKSVAWEDGLEKFKAEKANEVPTGGAALNENLLKLDADGTFEPTKEAK